MSSLTTNTANDARSEVLLLGTVVLAMTDLATVLAGLVLVVTEGTVKGSKLTELVSLEFVLAFGDRGGSLNDIVDKLLGLVDLLLSICHDQAVQVLLLVTGVSCVRPSFTLLDGTFSANGDLCARLRFHLFESVSTRSNK
jgi:hypothetical protein